MSRNEKPICSVCIANYNGIEVIADAVESVMAQDCDFPVEIIVHDDASTDGSAEFIRKQFPEVTLIASDRNVGFCISNNRMAAQSKGEYILLLNNDARLFPDALRTLYSYAREREGKTGILGLPQYNSHSGELIDLGSLLDPFLNTIPNLSPKRTEVGMVIGACLWLRRSLWDELGGFLNFFQSMGEDIYLCCLARLWGYEVEIIQSSGFWHRVGNSFGGGKVVGNRLSTSKRRRPLSERNKSYVIALTYPPILFLLIYPIHLMLLLLEGAALSVLKRDPSLWQLIYWRCIRSQWHSRRMLHQMRKRIQRCRRISELKFLNPFVFVHQKLLMLVRHGMPEIR